MPEPEVGMGALAAGALCATAVLAVASESRPWRLRGRRPGAARTATLRVRLAALMARAGWNESPERMSALAAVLAAALAALGFSTAAVAQPLTALTLGVMGAAAGFGAVAFALRSGIAGRRSRLRHELMPLLELFTLELGAGGSAITALGSVTIQLEGELATDLRKMLIASQVAGSASFESRLRAYADELEIDALGSLATILAASREYGTPVIHGVRALAADLRGAQRRELIAHSRRALNHVLIPAALGVLLPFLAILLFPAVTALQRSLR
jgi:pilus assembly protein TadC